MQLYCFESRTQKIFPSGNIIVCLSTNTGRFINLLFAKYCNNEECECRHRILNFVKLKSDKLRQCIIIHSCNIFYFLNIHGARVLLCLLFRRQDCESRCRQSTILAVQEKSKGGQESRRRENIRAELEHGRRNKTRKLVTSVSLSPSLRPSSSCLSSPSLSAVFPFERVTPSGFPLFTFIWIFLAARGPSSSHSLRALRKLACTSPPHFSSLSQSPSFFPFYFFFPS